jgi:hypothetical protein
MGTNAFGKQNPFARGQMPALGQIQKPMQIKETELIPCRMEMVRKVKRDILGATWHDTFLHKRCNQQTPTDYPFLHGMPYV